jgi:2-polyprenyl-3-methyl-5-hydroxy-6-metoxy-1,4-benzoquinol methylase
MASYTGEYYAQHYAPIQHVKYAQLWPQIKPFFTPHSNPTLLDIGIGPAWIESFLAEKNVSFSRVVGVDVSEASLHVRKKGIEYVISPHFDTKEKFDIVICFDAWHCFPELDLKKFLKPNGLLLVSEPLTFEKQLEKLSGKRMVDVCVGEMEKSRAVLVKNLT